MEDESVESIFVDMTNKRNTGIDLEHKVESWAVRRFKASHSDTRYLVNGLSVRRPYEVDVWIQIPQGLFGWFTIDIWIECKDTMASIKRSDISLLVSKAKDVYQAAKKGKQDLYFNNIMFVATSRYDNDAIAYADQEGVTCYLYKGKSYALVNNREWDDKPKWLQEVEATS